MSRIKLHLPSAIDILEGMTEKKLKAGYIKFNIPSPDNIDCLNGEGVWGWVPEKDKPLYHSDDYHGNLFAILCNDPMYYGGQLKVGDIVTLKCHGESRPTLDPKWVRYHLDGWTDGNGVSCDEWRDGDGT